MIRLVYLFLFFPLMAFANQKYFSWIDHNGDLRNSFVKQEAVSQIDLSNYRALSLSEFVTEDNRIASVGYQLNPKSSKERKRKYYTWIEADGRTHNTEYASAPQQIQKQDLVLQGGDLASDYIDADQLARQGFVRDGDENPSYAWIDPTGRLVNSEYKPGPAFTGVSKNVIDYTEGNQFAFDSLNKTPDSDLSSEQYAALGDVVPDFRQHPKSVISLDKKLAARIQDTCCAQIAISDFYPLTPDDDVYEKLGKLSPSYDFPTGHSYYIPIMLPQSSQSYGVKIKSFAQSGLFYPVMLFLDADRKPTRYVTDAVVEYHEETWDRYAHLEGRVKVSPSSGERFVLIFTTEEDSKRVTQNKTQLALLEEHEHSKVGSLEIKVIY